MKAPFYDSLEMYMDDEKPPSNMDSTPRRILTPSVLRRKIRRRSSRVDFVCLIHGSGLRRRSFNL